MNCRTIQTELPDVLRGAADPETAALVRAHLAECLVCAGRAEAIAQLYAELGKEPEAAPPAAYWSSLVPRIHERIERRAARFLPEWVRRMALPASAGLLLVLVAVRGITLGPEPASSLGDVLRQLPEGEVARVEEQVEGLYGSYASAVTAEPAPSDAEVLKEIIPPEEQSVLYSRFDVETLVEGLSDQESTQLVALLEEHSSQN